MNGKPWAEPRASLDKRLVAAEVAIANVDTAAERRAIMRELVEGAWEQAATRLDVVSAVLSGTHVVSSAWMAAAAAQVRALADAPAR